MRLLVVASLAVALSGCGAAATTAPVKHAASTPTPTPHVDYPAPTPTPTPKPKPHAKRAMSYNTARAVCEGILGEDAGIDLQRCASRMSRPRSPGF